MMKLRMFELGKDDENVELGKDDHNVELGKDDQNVQFDQDKSQMEDKEYQLGEDELVAYLVQEYDLFRISEEHEMDPGDDYDPEVVKAAFKYTSEPEEDYYHDPYEDDPVWDSDWSNDNCHWK
ncbi:uncharacterized protein LOC143631796 [Bidens hawaiensis]|uniref:uncharacterized protein LOC143631796 n=1 Tax=Bidens hawaiensis TaxID=980011 RepID=UPI00404AEDB8